VEKNHTVIPDIEEQGHQNLRKSINRASLVAQVKNPPGSAGDRFDP